MSKSGKKSKPPKISTAEESSLGYSTDREKAREIKMPVILEQLKELKEKGLITEKEFKNRKRQLFGPNNEVSKEKAK
jgi:DNA-binding HxlR family transcriptional regulator